MQLKQLINDAGEYAVKNNICNTAMCGTSLYDVNFKQDNLYPLIYISPSQNNNITNSVITYNITLYYIDRLLRDNDNDIDIISTSINHLQKLVNSLKKFDYVLKIDNNYQITNFADSSHLADNVAGAYVSLNVSVKNNIGNCDIDVELPNINISTIIYQIKDINITENGDYNVSYDSEYNALKEVNVNVNIDTDSYYNDGYNEGFDDGKEEQKALLESITITENGNYTNENGYDEVTVEIDTDSYYNDGFNTGKIEGYNEGYEQGDINGREEQKSLLENIVITENGVFDNENGYDEVTVEIDTQSYYNNGYNEGYVQGESEGYNDGFSEGFDEGVVNGKEEQKSLLESIKITENGVFDNENGYDVVNVEIDTQSYYDNGYNEGYNNGEVNGIEQGKEEQKSLLTSINITTNGNYTNENGYNEVIVNVGGEIKPKLPNGITLQGSTFSSIDMSKWNWSNVYDWGEMFSECTNLTEIQNFPTDVEILATAYMFNNCNKLTSIPSFDTSNVINMSYMFNQCTYLTSLDVSSFNTSNVIDMKYMFNQCSYLTSLDVSSFNTSNVIDMKYIFNKCYSLTSLDLSSFDTSNVRDMKYMFNECESLTSLDVSSFDTSNVTNMYGMFQWCSSLTSLDLSSFDTSNVRDMGYMFNRCYNITTISNLDITNVTSMSYIFNSCYKLQSIRFKGKPSSALGSIAISMFTDAGRDIETPILYFPSEFVNDYQKIINVLPSKWTAVPY